MRLAAVFGMALICSCTSTESGLSAGSGGGCAAGTKPCGTACVAFDAPATGCGAPSCNPCPAMAHGSAICVQGSCSMGPCDTGYADCDHQPSNGCETDTRTSSAHCGACGVTCTFAHTQSTCADSVCQVTSCEGTFKDCNGLASDGCESDTDSDPKSCSACGNACDTGAVCYKGACASNGDVLAWLDTQKGGWCLDDYQTLINLCGKVSVCHYNLCGDLDTDSPDAGTCYDDYQHEHEKAVPFCCDTRFLKPYPNGIVVDLGFHYYGVSTGFLFDLGGDTGAKRLNMTMTDGAQLSVGLVSLEPLTAKLQKGTFLVSYHLTQSKSALFLNGILAAEGTGAPSVIELAAENGPGLVLGSRISYWWESANKKMRFAPFLFHIRDGIHSDTWSLAAATESGPDTLLLFRDQGVTGNAWTAVTGPETGYAITTAMAEPEPVWKSDAASQCF
jgi:hypothetical protein